MLENVRLIAIAALVFMPLITVVVTIHELGHFSAAKMFGVAIDQFSIGFGKAIAKRTDKSGVEWRLGWIPLGGYVRFGGDTNDASLPDTESLEELRRRVLEVYGPEGLKRYLHFKPLWQRAIIAAAGPLANFILAFVIFCLFLAFTAQALTPAIAASVLPGSPAAIAGFQPGDKIVRANGHAIRDFDSMARYIAAHANDTVVFDVQRRGQALQLSAKLQRVAETDPLTKTQVKQGQLGVGRPDSSTKIWYHPPLSKVPGEALSMVWKSIEAPLEYIGRILTGKENGDQLSGVIGMAHVSEKVASASLGANPGLADVGVMLINMVMLTASLSVGIGFVNLLPIPVLDGGHLMFYAYEAIARRPVGPGIQTASYKVGLALVLGLMLFGAWNDLQRLQAFKFLGGLFS